MSRPVDSEQLQNFHERLSQWVSSQGFWFQLKYSFSGVGSQGALTYHLMKLITRVLVVCAIVAAGFSIYLFKKPQSESYKEDVTASLENRLHAAELQVKGLKEERGEFQIQRLAMIGGKRTFFNDLEISNLRCQRSMADFFRKTWDPGVIEISQANLGLKAGADSEDDATAIRETFFPEFPDILIHTIKVADMSLRWGYSNNTKGTIIGSDMTAQRTKGGWKLKFRGGTFSQNWLKRLQIEEMDVIVDGDGIVFEKGIFTKGEGRVVFEDVKVSTGQRPELSGLVRLRKMNVADLIPMSARSYVEGSLSGTFKVSGSTNSGAGVGLEGKITLEGEDLLVLRDQIPLLKALSVVDSFNTYRRLDLDEGSFKLKSNDGVITVSEVNLRAGSLLSLKGGINVRTPSTEEIDTFTRLQRRSVDREAIMNDDEIEESIDLTLSTAGRNLNEEGAIGFKKAGDNSLFDKLGVNLEKRREDARIAEHLTKTLQYEGEFLITMPRESFAKAPKLLKRHGGDENSTKVTMKVPIQGTLSELTVEQSAEIYRDGSR